MGEKIEPIRIHRVALAIIKTSYINEGYLLLQYDIEAGRHQLIGGRINHLESPIEALIREVSEELPELNLSYNQDFSLIQLNNKAIAINYLSPTTKMTTVYEFWIFLMKLNGTLFNPNKAINRWFKISELLDRKDNFYTLIEDRLKLKLYSLENSIEYNNTNFINEK